MIICDDPFTDIMVIMVSCFFLGGGNIWKLASGNLLQLNVDNDYP